MKQLIILILLTLSAIGSYLAAIWAIVEFILYLVKDRPFHWISVWTTLGCWVMCLVLMFAKAFVKESISDVKYLKRKSRFEERLEKLSEERKNKF